MTYLLCLYCGMSYDGERYANCPHCNAPRSRNVIVRDHVTIDRLIESGVLNEEQAMGAILCREPDATFFCDDDPYYRGPSYDPYHSGPSYITYEDLAKGMAYAWQDEWWHYDRLDRPDLTARQKSDYYCRRHEPVWLGVDEELVRGC